MSDQIVLLVPFPQVHPHKSTYIYQVLEHHDYILNHHQNLFEENL